MNKPVNYIIKETAMILGKEIRANTMVFKNNGVYYAGIGRDKNAVPVCLVGSATAAKHIDVTHEHQTHELKTERKYYIAIANETKKFEVRYNDRDFQDGDILILREINKSGEYTGREQKVLVTFILDDLRFCIKDHVIMSIERI